jgi:ferric-dicitrate binding protein FerR (iron transport regulator)
MMDENAFAKMTKQHHPEHKEAVRTSILKKMEDKLSFKVVPLYRRSFFRIAVAACIAALIFVGGYFTLFDKPDTTVPPIAKATDVEAPKSDKAMITLPDGRVIAVDSLTSYAQGSVTVTRMADGRLVYAGPGTEVVFNTLTNPRGSKVIDMTLADGSRVWLNAGSSVTYPVAFVGHERKVNITGEAYFEVAHNASMPFKVSKGEMVVTVLGTHFNVNAYDEEADIKVTLLEGSVKVNNTLIKPGQQAVVGKTVKIVNGVMLDEVMAWKNGFFHFNRASLEEVLGQLTRWYDVEVVYEGKIPERQFLGEMERDLNLSQVLKILERNQVHFRIEGKKVIVMP